MSVRHYTIDQLVKLRESPLVKKPEDLPAIEQWLEYLYLDKDSREKLRIPHSESSSQPQAQPQQLQPQKDNVTKDAKTRVTRPSNNGDASPMGNFSTGQRPSLMATRTNVSKSGGMYPYAGEGGTRLTAFIDDVVLGPPKTAFSSSSRFARTNASAEATTGSEDAEGARARTFGDRQQTRNTKTTGEKEGGRDWTALRQPRGPGETDEQKESNDRLAKYGRRDRERDQDGERRNGDKQDSRWGQREERGQRDDRRQNGERQGGWRDRESNRQNNRGWDRDQAEKEPEWFDEPMKKQEEDLGVGTAHTQADFQKWKEMMKGNKALVEEVAPVQPPPVQTTPAKQGASMKLDGFSEPMFGGFGGKSTEAPLESVVNTTKAAPTPSKAKSSRFASVFKKDEAPPAPVHESPAPQQPMLEAGQGLNEDKAGFQRILQMLGGANIGSPQEAAAPGGPSEPASPQVRGPAGGAKQKSRFFDSIPQSPDVNSPQSRFQSPRVQPGNNIPPANRNMVDDPNGFFGLPMPQKGSQESALPFPPSNVVSPEPAQPSNGQRDSYPPQHRPNEPNVSAPPSRGPPSRGPATPDVGIQNLLAAQRAQRPHAPNKDSEFLLGLLQGQGPRPASQQARPHQDFNLWVGQPPEPHAPKPRAPPPPGLIDDQLLRNAPPEMSRPDQSTMPGQDLGRRTSQRAPPGAPPGFDEHAMFMQQHMQQRRNFPEGPQQPQQPPPNRRMPGHPSMSGMMPPQQQQQQPQFPPDFPFMQSPPLQHQGPPQGGPPPGFAPNMRHPQGFANVPNIFQAQQQREPPGFAGMMQNPMSPPVPPPGFGAPMPPGLMGMRSPPDGLPAGAAFRGAGRGYDTFDGQRR
jgi:hypothetical protein